MHKNVLDRAYIKGNTPNIRKLPFWFGQGLNLQSPSYELDVIPFNYQTRPGTKLRVRLLVLASTY